MQKRMAVVLVVILFFAVGLSGCTDSNNRSSELDRFVGTWKYGDEETITFFSDGILTCLANYSGVITNVPTDGTYEIKDRKFVLHLNDRLLGYITLVNDYHFSDNDTVLTTTHIGTDSVTVYTKI